jgi:hypothetical protein
MDEYTALAQRVVLSTDDVRGCLVLSRDGLVLGAFPEDEEASIKPAWLRFVNVGDARKSFIEFGDQIWAYVNRGPYGAFVVAGPAVRPGILLDQLEQALLVAEETRTTRDTLKLPDASAAPSGKPRSSLHPQDRPQPVQVTAAGNERPDAAKAGKRNGPEAPAQETQPAEEATAEAGDAPAPQKEDPASALAREPQRLVSSESATEGGEAEEPGEIDRVMLAQEFSGLLQMDSDGDEDNS